MFNIAVEKFTPVFIRHKNLLYNKFLEYGFGREEIINMQMVATANNRRTFNIIYLHYLQNNSRKIK